VSRFDTIPDLPLDATAEVAAALLELTAMAAEVPVNAPWNAKQAEAWDSMTGQTWIDDNVDSSIAATVIEVAIGGPTGVRAADVSLPHYLFIAQAAGGPRDLITQGEACSSIASSRAPRGWSRISRNRCSQRPG
jgi:monoamine oxidase